GVPVVAATGNSGYNDGVSWPACVPRVVKVSAVNNHPVSNGRASYANLASADAFPGDYIWLAPGGGNGSIVISSFIAGVGGMAGTSQAAPHVAGLYAAIKSAAPGVSVNGASEWIRFNATVPVEVQLSPTNKQTFGRVRLPNL
ncbi:MAG: S8 family serine peptidase, partial [Ramlibacter sp.]|nr:S8 family serine peptidase [Ramlibacter sp.]